MSHHFHQSWGGFKYNDIFDKTNNFEGIGYAIRTKDKNPGRDSAVFGQGSGCVDRVYSREGPYGVGNVVGAVGKRHNHSREHLNACSPHVNTWDILSWIAIVGEHIDQEVNVIGDTIAVVGIWHATSIWECGGLGIPVGNGREPLFVDRTSQRCRPVQWAWGRLRWSRGCLHLRPEAWNVNSGSFFMYWISKEYWRCAKKEHWCQERDGVLQCKHWGHATKWYLCRVEKY